MPQENTIITDEVGSVASITLNRPDVHNAMNITMIRELARFVNRIETGNKIRILSINSTGKNFSAGADLNWMKEGLKQDKEQLKSESMELAGLFRTLWESEIIVLAAVQGIAMGGANGLVATSDIVIAENTTRFSFSEVKMGLVPATISPFIVRKIGLSRSTELMLTGRWLDAYEARVSGLVHEVCEEGSLHQSSDAVISNLLNNGPEAMKEIKRMLRWLETGPSADQIQEYTAALIAERRISLEGQEGMLAFLEKRNTRWHDSE